jgi:integration host factor subunit alpha|tara:strand:+ start:458 stop:745 length:288 start_codon:yes stop_codon:yes gene_type:complete
LTKKNFNKDNLYKLLSEKSGFSELLSKKIINDLIKIIIKEIKKENFNLLNLGKFKIINKKKRLGRNPKTKQTFIINQRKSISFMPSKNLSKILNE